MIRPISAFACAAALWLGAASAQAQNIYSTDFGTGTTPATGDNFLYSNQTNLASDTATGQGGWRTNDAERANNATNGSFVGGANFVGTVNSTPAYFTGYNATIGSTFRSATDPTNNVVPGVATSFLYRPFASPLTPGVNQGYQFTTGFAVTSSSANFPGRDTFGFALRDTTGGVLLSISFAPVTSAGTAITTRDGVGYTVGAVGNGATIINPNANAVVLNTQYTLTIQVNPVANTFSASVISAGAPTVIATNVSLTGAINALAVNQVAARWTVANQTTDASGAFVNAADNLLIIDNYAVSYFNIVPEPSTYAMLGVGLLAVLGGMKRRRTA